MNANLDGSMRCTDDDRLRVADQLNDAFADGRLSVEEHLERGEAVWKAKTYADLNALTTDLGASNTSQSFPSWPLQSPSQIQDSTRSSGELLVPPTSSNFPAMATNPSESEQTYSILSTTKRQEGWIVPKKLSSFILLGETVLDMRGSAFSSLDVEIDVSCTMGDLKLYIPDGVHVRDETVKIMADANFKGITPTTPGAPTIIVKGFLLMAELMVIGSDHKSWHRKRK